MLTIEDFPKLNVCIATPCYGGQVFQNYLTSIIHLVNDSHKTGLNLSFIIRGGDSLIPRARNSIVAEFLASEHLTHLLWVDGDIGFTVEQINRMIAVDRDVVAGVYPLKKIMWPHQGVPQGMTQDEFNALYTGYPFNPINKIASIDEQGFCEVLDAPTGLMLIKREVLVRMMQHYPGLKTVSDMMPGLEEIHAKLEPFQYRFFDVMTDENGRYLSEDYAFCRRWQNIGGKIYVDVQSELTHQGSHMYTGNLYKSLMARHAFWEAEAAKAAEAPPAENPPPPEG